MLFFNDNEKNRFNKLKFSILESDNPVMKMNFQNLNEVIEQVSEIYYFLLVKLSIPGVLVPPLVVTAINYYVYDSNSYFLPFPFLYAHFQLGSGQS